nr:shikimate dehydrogenase [Nocardioides panzhihuensis]
MRQGTGVTSPRTRAGNRGGPSSSGGNDKFLIGLIGSGITHSPTPALHEREADHQGLRYLYRVLDLPTLGLGPEDAVELVRGAARLGYTGLNVTHPAKQVVIPALDELDEVAEALGAVNTIRIEDGGRLVGYNTDVEAFGESLLSALSGRPLGRVLQVGAGGAGAATAYALLERGASALTLSDLDDHRADRLADRMRKLFPDAGITTVAHDVVADRVAKHDGVVNASPVGSMLTPGTPIEPALLTPHQWVADVVYRPLRTALIESAEEQGCIAIGGGGMMVGQAVYSFAVFTGCTADHDRVAAHFDQLVADRVWTDTSAITGRGTC